MEKIDYYYGIIENCIRKLGADPAKSRGEKPGQWDLKKGSANVWIDIWQEKQSADSTDNYGYFQAMAPVVLVPGQNQEEFYKELLSINHKLYGVGFTVFENWAYIKTVRELQDLSESEALAMINRVGNYADEYDDILQQKYHPGSSEDK
jgi:hypothetical protein